MNHQKAGLARCLLDIADAAESERGERLRKEDPRQVAAAVVAEISSRLALTAFPGEPVEVQFELAAGDTVQELVLAAGSRQPSWRAGRADDPQVTLRQDLAELVAALYGPERPGGSVTRSVAVNGEPGPASDAPDDPWLLRWQAATRAAGQVVNACAQQLRPVTELVAAVGADKWGENWFAGHYDRHFARYQRERVRLLEIGIGGFESPVTGGESLRLWKSYFRRGLIYGIDLFDKSPLTEDRITTLQADQSDPRSLLAAVDGLGDFDIIIDDGSHISEQTITAFTTLFPRLRPGGLYVVEDIQTSYWPGWNGNRRDFCDQGTWIGFVKALIDGLHHQDRVDDQVSAAPLTDDSVVGLHLYHNIVFIEKGLNAELTAPSWVRRDVNDMDLTPKGSMVPLD